MTEKTCTTCGESLSLDQFHKSKTGRYGVTSVCRACHAAKCKRYDKEHAEAHRLRSRAWDAENKERRDLRQYAYVCRKYKEDELFRLRMQYSRRVRNALKLSGRFPEIKITADMLGCSRAFFLAYMGAPPSASATIDHICPLSVAQTAEEVYKLNHYTNIRWLDRRENRSKSCFWTPDGARLCLQLLGREWAEPTEERHHV